MLISRIRDGILLGKGWKYSCGAAWSNGIRIQWQGAPFSDSASSSKLSHHENTDAATVDEHGSLYAGPQEVHDNGRALPWLHQMNVSEVSTASQYQIRKTIAQVSSTFIVQWYDRRVGGLLDCVWSVPPLKWKRLSNHNSMYAFWSWI